jgi:hypothetical protein
MSERYASLHSNTSGLTDVVVRAMPGFAATAARICAVATVPTERVGERDRGLEDAELVHLQEPNALAEAVDHDGGRGHLGAKGISAVRPDDGDAGLEVAARERAVADGHAGDVGDGRARAVRQDADSRRGAQGHGLLIAVRSSGRARRAGRRRAG